MLTFLHVSSLPSFLSNISLWCQDQRMTMQGSGCTGFNAHHPIPPPIIHCIAALSRWPVFCTLSNWFRYTLQSYRTCKYQVQLVWMRTNSTTSIALQTKKPSMSRHSLALLYLLYQCPIWCCLLDDDLYLCDQFKEFFFFTKWINPVWVCCNTLCISTNQKTEIHGT